MLGHQQMTVAMTTTLNEGDVGQSSSVTTVRKRVSPHSAAKCGLQQQAKEEMLR